MTLYLYSTLRPLNFICQSRNTRFVNINNRFLHVEQTWESIMYIEFDAINWHTVLKPYNSPLRCIRKLTEIEENLWIESLKITIVMTIFFFAIFGSEIMEPWRIHWIANCSCKGEFRPKHISYRVRYWLTWSKLDA